MEEMLEVLKSPRGLEILNAEKRRQRELRKARQKQWKSLPKKKRKLEKLRCTFQAYDTDGSGMLELEEFKMLAGRCPPTFSSRRLLLALLLSGRRFSAFCMGHSGVRMRCFAPWDVACRGRVRWCRGVPLRCTGRQVAGNLTMCHLCTCVRMCLCSSCGSRPLHPDECREAGVGV